MITNIRSGRERHSSAVLRFRNGSIIDASDDRNRSRRVRIFPLLITCPNWSITLITVSYGGEASRNDKISPLFPSPHQALFHPRVIPASPETVWWWTCTFATKRNLSPAGKNQPRFREEENGGPGHRGDGRGHRSHAPSAASRPRPLSDFPFLALRFPLHRPTPSLSKQRSGLASLPLPPSPPPYPAEAPPPAKRKSPSAAVRRWSKSVHTESSSRVEASSGQLAG